MIHHGDICKNREGNIPILLCSRHNGWTDELCGKQLTTQNHKCLDEINVSFFALGTFSCMKEKFGYYPHVLICPIERRFLIKSLELDFFSVVIQYLENMIEKYGYCLILDLHGFLKNKFGQDFDMIFGTANRITVPYATDLILSNALEDKYNVFVPSAVKGNNERFSGGWFSRRLFSLYQGSCEVIQIEFHKRNRWDENNLEKLIENFSEALYITLKNLEDL